MIVRILLLLLPFISLNLVANTNSFTINIDGTVINMTSPDGFHKVSVENKTAYEFAEVFTTPSFKLNAFLLTKDDIQRSKSGELPFANKYIFVKVHKKLIKHDISKSYFNNVKDVIKKSQYTGMNRAMKDIDKIMEGVSSRFNNEYDTDLVFGASDTVPLGIFLDKENAVGFTTVVTTLLDLNVVNRVIFSSTVLLVNKKLLSIYFYKTLDNLVNDKLWIEAKTREFVDLILEDNLASL